MKLGGLEIQLESVVVENLAETPLPFEPFGDKENLPALDFRLDWRYMDLRRTENLLLFRVQTTMEMALREFWIENGFMEMHSPKLMGSLQVNPVQNCLNWRILKQKHIWHSLHNFINKWRWRAVLKVFLKLVLCFGQTLHLPHGT